MKGDKSILEVWDYRLSTAQPMNYKGLPKIPGMDEKLWEDAKDKWCGVIFSQDEKREALEIFNSGVKAEVHHTDADMPDSIYEFYRSVRDKYSRENIEELKPHVAEIRALDVKRQKATDAYNAVMLEDDS